MKVGFKIIMDIEPERWAATNNGPWPEEDKRALNTAVRHDIKDTVRHLLRNAAAFEELGIKVEVK